MVKKKKTSHEPAIRTQKSDINFTAVTEESLPHLFKAEKINMILNLLGPRILPLKTIRN